MIDVMIAVNYRHNIEAIYVNGELYIDNYATDEDGFESFVEAVEDITRFEPARVSAPWYVKEEFVDQIIDDGFPKKFSDLLDKLYKR